MLALLCKAHKNPRRGWAPPQSSWLMIPEVTCLPFSASACISPPVLETLDPRNNCQPSPGPAAAWIPSQEAYTSSASLPLSGGTNLRRRQSDSTMGRTTAWFEVSINRNELKLLHSQPPLLPYPSSPNSFLKQDSSWLLPIVLTCPFSSRGFSTTKWPEEDGGLTPLWTCSPSIQSSKTRPGLPHLLASTDLLSHPPQLQRKSLASAVLQWLLPLTCTPPHPSFSPLPQAAPWL